MKKNGETLFRAVGSIDPELLDRAIGCSMQASEEIQTASNVKITKTNEAPRGKKLLRVGLIAAALTILLGVGAFASGLLTLRDGITYGELADSSAVIESADVSVAVPGSPDATGKIEYRRFYADENEEMTQESTLNRMLNAVDYYDYASVTFMEQRFHPGENNATGIDFTEKYTVTNDVELTTGRGYSTVTRFAPEDEPLDWEYYCTGDLYIQLDLNKREINIAGTPRQRMTAEFYDEWIKDNPIHSYEYDEQGNRYEAWHNRTDWPNAYHSSSCIMPNMYALDLLTDLNNWTLDGEGEYLGRKCLYLTVHTVEDYFESKWGTTHFTLCVDKLTGILLEMKGYDDAEELKKAMIVSEIAVDQAEYTSARIDAGIERCEGIKHEFIYGANAD